MQEEQRRAEQVDTSLTAQDRVERERLRQQQMAEVAAISRAEADGLGDDPVLKGAHWSEKVHATRLSIIPRLLLTKKNTVGCSFKLQVII